jgi:hypothetical protein
MEYSLKELTTLVTKVKTEGETLYAQCSKCEEIKPIAHFDHPMVCKGCGGTEVVPDLTPIQEIELEEYYVPKVYEQPAEVVSKVEWETDWVDGCYYVYHCLDAGGTVVYIGVSSNPVSRLRSHLLEKPDIDTMVVKEKHEQRAAALWSEYEQIDAMRPTLNRKNEKPKEKTTL